MRSIYHAILTCLVAWSMSAVVTAQSTTVMLNPSQDNTLYESIDGSLSNGKGSSFVAGKTNNGELRRGLIQFDLSAIPMDAIIESASLTFNIKKGRGGTQNISMYRTLQAWGEGTSNDTRSQGGRGVAATAGDATWTHAIQPDVEWEHPGGNFELLPSVTMAVTTVPAINILDGEGLVSDIQGWVDGSLENFGWTLLSDEANNQTTLHFDSREGGTKPVLMITYSMPVVESKLTVEPMENIVKIDEINCISGNDLTVGSAVIVPPTATTTCEGGVVTMILLGPDDLIIIDDQPVVFEGEHIVVYEVSDACGNTETVSYIITVEVIRNEDSFATCRDSSIQLEILPGIDSVLVEYELPTTTLGCDEDVALVSGFPSGSKFPVGTTEVTYILTSHETTDMCSFSVIITEIDTTTVVEEIDLELELTVSDSDLPRFKPNEMVLTIRNTSEFLATGIDVSVPLPAGLVVLVGGSEAITSLGEYTITDNLWMLDSLAGGESATLTLQLFPLSDEFVPYAQVIAADQTDRDSTPGNGACCISNEDDEAAISNEIPVTGSDCPLEDTVILPSDICTNCLSEVAIYEFEGELFLVEIAGNANGCADGMTRVRDCAGNDLCREGGFAGFDECRPLRFFEFAVKVRTLAVCEIASPIDLELSINSDVPDIAQWGSGTFTITVSNNSQNRATGVSVSLPLNPEEVIIVGGTTVELSGGTFTDGLWEGIALAPGRRATLEFQLFSKVPNLTLFAQVTTADQPDRDSTPGNGTCCKPTEDDEDVFTSSNRSERLIGNTIKEGIQTFPNPVTELLSIQSNEAEADYQLLDINGKVVRAGKFNYTGQIDIADLWSGVYILKVARYEAIRVIKQ